jgi:hypothetical protein
MAISSALLPAAVRGTGLALLVTATSLARIVAAIAFGAVWTSAGSNVALVAFAAGLATAIVAAAVTFIRMGKEDIDHIAVA